VIYERLCRFAERVPLFNRIEGRQRNKELQRAVKFLSPLMSLTSRGVVSAAYLSSSSSLAFVLLALYLFQVGLILAIPLALMLAVLIYYLLVNYPVSLMNGYRLSLSEEADLVYEQFILVFQSGGTIFDAIEMVADSDHPYLSKAFKDIIRKVNLGIAPEESLREFASNQPSDDLRRYFTAILSALEKKTDLLESLSGESYEADMTLRQKNLELESRLLVIAALATYMPIVFTLGVSLGGYATNPVILLVAPLFVAIVAGMSRRFTGQFSAYFDRPRDISVVGPTQREIREEYDEFLNFLILLGERLTQGDTLEVALAETRESLEPEAKRLVDIAVHAIYQEQRSSAEAISQAAEAALGQGVAGMLRMISAMCETSTSQAGPRISKIATRLVKRSAVAKERDSIIAAQRIKVYLLTLTSAAVLGMLASLAPFLSIASLLSGEFSFTGSILTIQEIAPLIVALGVTTFSTGFLNTRMVGGSRPFLVALACLLLFWIAFMLSSGLMGLSLV
jgi:pilus assembly protein TadC